MTILHLLLMCVCKLITEFQSFAHKLILLMLVLHICKSYIMIQRWVYLWWAVICKIVIAFIFNKSVFNEWQIIKTSHSPSLHIQQTIAILIDCMKSSSIIQIGYNKHSYIHSFHIMIYEFFCDALTVYEWVCECECVCVWVFVLGCLLLLPIY